MPSVTRGCGKRQQGGAYLEVPTGPHGRDVSYFLVDPPQPIDKQQTGISAIGVTLFPDPEKEVEPGVKLHHVLDWVGSEHYPNVADFVEEVRRFGLSRRIARTADFAGLGHGSKIYLAHSRAVIVNHEEHYRAMLAKWGIRDEMVEFCPKDLHPFREQQPHWPDLCCAGLWWNDVEGGEWIVERGAKNYWREVGDTKYSAFPPFVKSTYQLGIFAIFPLVKVAVIRANDGSHELTEHAASRGKLPISLEDE